MQLVTNGGRLEPPNYCPGPLYGLMCQVKNDEKYTDHNNDIRYIPIMNT